MLVLLNSPSLIYSHPMDDFLAKPLKFQAGLYIMIIFGNIYVLLVVLHPNAELSISLVGNTKIANINIYKLFISRPAIINFAYKVLTLALKSNKLD